MKRQLVIALVIGVAGAVGPGIPVVHAQAPVSQSASDGGSKEGIKVHGHWTIEVRNSDGSLASRHEFDNALQQAGGTSLAFVLGRGLTVGSWVINLGASGVTEPACDNGQGPTLCRITESDAPIAGPHVFNNLVVRLVAGLELSGHATALRDGVISFVSTQFGECGPNTTPAACAPLASQSFPHWFTTHILATPITVAAGQIVQVKVVLSFS